MDYLYRVVCFYRIIWDTPGFEHPATWCVSVFNRWLFMAHRDEHLSFWRLRICKITVERDEGLDDVDEDDLERWLAENCG